MLEAICRYSIFLTGNGACKWMFQQSCDLHAVTQFWGLLWRLAVTSLGLQARSRTIAANTRVDGARVSSFTTKSETSLCCDQCWLLGL